MEQMEAGLEEIRKSPRDSGTLKLIVCRPDVGVRAVQETAELDPAVGLVGDNWKTRGSRHTPDGMAEPDKQLNVMNSRAVALVAKHPDRWALAGDQLFVDLDLSSANLPTGTNIEIGTALIQVTSPPHLGCGKFAARFGNDAMMFVNSPKGRELNLRGINARVVRPGVITVGDFVRKF